MVKDHLGHTFPDVRSMYLFWGLTEWVYYQRKMAGWSTEQILTTPLKKRADNCLDDLNNYTKKLRKKRKTDRPYEKRVYKLRNTTKYRLEHGSVTVREYQRG